MQWPPGGSERLLQRLECLRVVIIAVDIVQELDQTREASVAEAPVMLKAVLGARAKLFEIPARFGDADDRDV